MLGYYIGAPKKLTYYTDILRYYRTLASKSPRVKVLDIGKTDEGRECVIVFVGSEDSIKNLETERQDLAQLADPRKISEADARAIIAKAKPIYHVMGGLHSAETGPPEMLMELVYRLATEDTPLIKTIRDNVIVSVTPVAEPDGRIHAGCNRLLPGRVRIPPGACVDLAIGLEVPDDARPGLYHALLQATERVGLRALLTFPVGLEC